MKMKLNSKELLERLQYLSGVVPTNSTLPILENFLFEFDGNNLKITASDLESTMTSKMEVENIDLTNICIPSRLLIDILKSLPSQPIEIIVSENNTIEIISSSGNYSIAYYTPEQFPKSVVLENPTSITIPLDVLDRAIKKTLFACGSDDLRPVMSSVLFQMKTTGMTFVATDAHRLVKYTRKDYFANDDVDFVVPKKPLGILKGTMSSIKADDVEIKFNAHNASFTFGDYELTTRLTDGKYPNYEAVIPKDNSNQFKVSTTEIVNSLKRVSIFSNKQTHQVALKQNNNELTLLAEDTDYSTNGKEVLTCEPLNGEIEIGFNARFLLDALNNIDDAILTIETSVPNRAAIIKPEKQQEGEELLILVMPVMLKN